ncbi:hypothetical protein ADIARSV_0078 [Arcticibacter svalbardensis MN12-7]|uniref:Uncharacterized protein n=1 Tax=Arcticibacter svalbardensis MN12-7 TaxID=1150600 RepID=R9GYW3_9SPHI|nr:hypothetical protein ADIARSV_0078 [Arcticibacter svalbardensis MN12-7]
MLFAIGILILIFGNVNAQIKKTAKKKYDVAAFLYLAYANDDPRLRSF